MVICYEWHKIFVFVGIPGNWRYRKREKVWHGDTEYLDSLPGSNVCVAGANNALKASLQDTLLCNPDYDITAEENAFDIEAAEIKKYSEEGGE